MRKRHSLTLEVEIRETPSRQVVVVERKGLIEHSFDQAAAFRVLVNEIKRIKMNLKPAGEKVSDHRQELAHELGADLPDVFLSGRDQKVVYTTNAIESLNMSLRKIIKNRAAFPSEEAAYKLLYLAWQNIEKKWTMPIQDWARALNQLAILFDGRFTIQNSLTQNF